MEEMEKIKKVNQKLWLIILPIVLFILNIWLVLPLFQGEYTQYMGSIECQLLAQTRFIADNFPSLSWYPFWYFGFPFYLIYLPVVSFVLAFFHGLTELPISSLYRIGSGIFYALSPVSVFFLVRYLTKKNLVALISGLVYSFFPSICYLIDGIYEAGQNLDFPPWRLVVLTVYGEGAHTWALAFLPLALLFVLLLLRKPSVGNWIGAVFFTLTVLLTSVTAFMPFFVMLLILAISEICRGQIIKKKILSFLLFLGFVFGFSSFWYNFSFLKTLFGFAGPAGGGSPFTGTYQNPSLILFLFVPLLAIFIVFIAPLFRRFSNFFLYFFTIFSFLVLFFSLYFRYKFNAALIPLPFGYLPRVGPEVELSFVLMLGAILAALLTKINHFSKKIGLIAGTILLALTLTLLPKSIAPMREITQPNKDITKTSEYNISQWLSEKAKDVRIYATGTHTFWLNAFSDVAQVRGAGDQAIVNPLWAHLFYQIYWGDEGKLAVDWLKALGIKYIVVNFPESKVTFKDFRYPYKFEPLLKKVFEYRGDAVYEVPTEHTGLAFAVKKEDLNKTGIFWKIKEGKEVLDKEKLAQYLAATENSLDFRDLEYSYQKPWREIEIKAQSLKPNEAILLRISYHRGFKAYQNGRRIEVERDPLGFILLSPNPGENQDLILKFKPTFDIYLGYFLSFLTLIVFIFFLRRSAHRLDWLDKKREKAIESEIGDEDAQET